MTKRQVWILALVITAITAAVSVWGRTVVSPEGNGVDDADIFLRYARNLLDGHGLVWNPGGERVEGFSSPIWLSASTAAMALTPTKVDDLLFGFNTALLTIGLMAFFYTSWRQFRRPDDDRRNRIFFLSFILGAALWGASSPQFVIWTTTSLMDSGLWVSLVLVTLAFGAKSVGCPRARIPLSCCLAVAVLARPEGSVIGLAVLSACITLTYLETSSARRAFGAYAVPLAVLILSIVLLHGVRLLYFGHPFPNTYYAKVDSRFSVTLANGFRYVLRTLSNNPMIAAGGVAAVFLTGKASLDVVRRRGPSAVDPTAFLASVVFLTFIAIQFATGGDHFPGFRMLLPLWPITFLLILVSVRRLPLGLLAIVPLALPFLVGPVEDWPSGPIEVWSKPRKAGVPHFDIELSAAGRKAGRSLNELFEAEPGGLPTISVIAAGGLPYTYRGPVFDMMGLNDVEMAHSKDRRREGPMGHSAFDRAILLERRPDLVLTNGFGCRRDRPRDPLALRAASTFLGNLHQQADFLALYSRVFVAPSGTSASGKRAPDVGLCGYASGEFLARYTGDAIAEW